MEALFLKILNMSITAGWLVLAVLLLRPLLKKAPRYLTVIMWALVGIRLLLPFTLESALSLIPSTETVPPEIIYEQAPQLQTGIDVFNSAVNPVISETFAPNPGDSVNPLQIITWAAAWIWVLGMAAMALYTLISYLRIYRKVREAAPLQGNVWLCDRIDTPFIFGLFRPRIYLPSAMAEGDMPYVIAHEQAHLKRKDHLWKPLGFLLLTVHWFNPLLWVAYVLLCRDIEVACDEKVLKSMGEDVKKPYSQALVNCSMPRKMIAACPLAFGEVGVKQRVKNVLNYKKPAFWLLIAAVIVCIVLSVCFLTNPRTANEKMQIFLDCQIAEHHQSEKSKGRACCLDYEILGTEKSGKTTTVYMWVLYEEYSYQNGVLQTEVGAHIPTVITATKADGNYQLVEYWEPRDGNYYAEDIHAKFPWYLQAKALDSQRYIDRQQKACLELAEQYFQENPPTPNTDPAISEDRVNTDLERLQEELLRKQQVLVLQEKYPQYFDLPTNNGLEVYVWQMAPGSYDWGLLPGRAVDYYETTLLDLQGASLEEIRIIVDAYGLDRSMISVCPIQMPYSSYYYVIDDAYRQKVEALFWFGLDFDPDTFGVTVSYAGDPDTNAIYAGALNRDKMAISSVRHLPILKFDTREELEQFMWDYVNVATNSAEGRNGIPSFQTVAAQYDEAFFAENSLLLVYVACGNCTYRFDVNSIFYDDASLCVHVEETTGATEVADAEANWFIAVAVPDTVADNCTTFDATLNND